jgi:hypothetical protein
MGDAALELEWMGVRAQFAVHCDKNAAALTASLIERSAMDRALNGTWVDSYFQGKRVMEDVRREGLPDLDDAALIELGYSHADIYESRPVKVWMKPSDALTIKMMESWNRRYRSHQEVEVRLGGVLRLDQPHAIKQIEHSDVFDVEATEVETRGGHLAVAGPAKSSEDMDALVEAGQFAPKPVTFTNAAGEVKTLKAEPVTIAKVEPPKPYARDRIAPGAASSDPSERLGHGLPNRKTGYRVG